MRIGLLGTVTIETAGTVDTAGTVGAGTPGASGAPAPGGPLLRGALARLALDADRPVSTTTLLGALWGDEPPEANALQAMISRLRRALGADRVASVPGGYRLVLEPQRVDALRFTALVAQAREAHRPEQVRALLSEAAGLWRGPALADVRRLPFAAEAAARLEEQHAVAVELAAAAALRLGEPETQLDALHDLLAADPLRESAAVALARNLHATGRRVDALAVLDRTRARLADELGVDPGAALAAARLTVLRATPAAPRRAPGSTGVGALTSFVGRAPDVARVTGLLSTGRLVTLTGPGGAGKTRLATEVAQGLPGEVRVAELAPLGGADQLAGGVLAAVRTAEIVARAPDESDTGARLLAALAGRDLLLVLDNCEHLVDAVARLTHTLLTRTPGLRVLATSREPLGVPGETLHAVDALPDDEAVRLFAERGGAVAPGFAVTDAVRPAVREICRRLDGQPLAIELAAARLRTLTPTEIQDRLDDRFRLLTSRARTAPSRHQTLRAVVDWSWDLLAEPERALARRLSVFAGGATEEAARAVGGSGDDTLDLLTALVEKSLLVATPGRPTRYRMLETIRAYAGERLDEAGERAAVEAAHARVVLELVETTEPRLRRPGQLEWVARLRAESDDVTAVLRRALAAGDAPTAQRLAAASAWFWMIRGLFGEATEHLRAVGALDDPAPVPPAAGALCAAYRAMVAAGEGDFATAVTHLAAAERLAAPLPPDRHPVLLLMGPVAAGFGHDDPVPLERLGADPAVDPWARAFALFARAQVAENVGDRARARDGTRAAHAMFAALGDRWGLGMTLATLGDLEQVTGTYDAAERAFDEAIALAEELDNVDDLPQFEAERARLWVRRGDVAAGRAELRRIAALPGLHPELAGNLHLYLADAARRAGELDEARRELALDDPATFVGGGIDQRRAVHATVGSAVARAAGDGATAAALLAAAVAHAMRSKDGPVTASVAERAAAHALADGDAGTAAALLEVAVAQRGELDIGDPDVRATLDAVRAAGAPAPARRSRAEGLALLQDWSSRLQDAH